MMKRNVTGYQPVKSGEQPSLPRGGSSVMPKQTVNDKAVNNKIKDLQLEIDKIIKKNLELEGKLNKTSQLLNKQIHKMSILERSLKEKLRSVEYNLNTVKNKK